MGKQQLRVLIVDSHPLFREGIKAVIQGDERYQVVAEADSSSRALELCARHTPDLVVTEVALPAGDGYELTRKIKTAFPRTKVVLVSMQAGVAAVPEAYQAGALGYVLKDSPVEVLLFGLEQVANGTFFIDSTLSEAVAKALSRVQGGPDPFLTPVDHCLTKREIEILRLLAEGRSSKEVANLLFISPKTVDNHRTNIQNKLGLHSTLDLIRYAIRIGVVDVGVWQEEKE